MAPRAPPSAAPPREASPREGPRAFTIAGHRLEAPPLPPGLHVVATPIGNLRDVTLRALETLAAADAILAEDTRVTRVLLSHYGIATPCLSYHEHSDRGAEERFADRMAAGEALALVSDAGTPLLSDPGFRLVATAVARGLPVVPLPGPSAALAALVAAGLPSDRFFFEGFLPAKAGPRRSRLAELAAIPGTLVLYEAPHRVAETVADAAAVLGPRPAAVARELTKFYETVRRGPLDALAAEYAAEPAPRGEIVILIGAAPADAGAADARAGLDEKLRAALALHSVKDAAAIVSAETGLKRRDVYARALQLGKTP